MNGQLEIIAGPDKGRVFPFQEGQELLLGRGVDTTTRLADPYASRHHCRLKIENGAVVLSDLGSTTGTRVNGVDVGQPQTLAAGDVITVGATELRLEIFGVHEEGTMRLPPGGLKSVQAVDKTAPLPARTSPPPQPAPPARTGPPPAPPRCTDLADLVGTRLKKFDIDKQLAQGQSSAVFKAREFDSGRVVALKLLLPKLVEEADLVQRFLSNMKIMQSLRHPNLVEVYEAERDNAYCWMSMEYVEGSSLKHVIEGIGMAGILDWRYALRVAIHVTRGLVFAASKALLHRNITPKNILIRQADNVAKLSDMLLAKAVESAQSPVLSSRGQWWSEMGYLAPERVAVNPVADARTDLYELGATVYALLTGHPPCVDTNPVQMIDKLQNYIPPGAKTVQLSVPSDFDRAVMRLLAKNPDHRYQRADQLLSQLDAIAKAHDLTIP